VENLVLYSDEHILVVNKPAGLLTIKDGYDPNKPFLIPELEPIFGKLYIVHRLDFDTSGVLILARNPRAHKELNNQFQHRNVNKQYHLIIASPESVPIKEKFDVDFPLRINVGHRHRTVVDLDHGKPAKTEIYILNRFSDQFYLMKAKPHSGYRHQIRAHSSAIGLWIINDPLYTPSLLSDQDKNSTHRLPENFLKKTHQIPINRIALHAYCIELSHPATDQFISFIAPYPDDFRAALDFFENHERWGKLA
jgi:RluA family pseudouridine synthase